MERPKSITNEEFCAKIELLKAVVEKFDGAAMYLCSEGGMRWLTGKRHQVVDIKPDTSTTIQAVVHTRTSTQPNIVFYSEPWESARVYDIIKSGPWNSCGIEASYGGTLCDFFEPGLICPAWENYREIERAIVSPLAQGVNGNQMDKLQWLASESRQALISIAKAVHVGMTGWEMRTLVYQTYHERHIELNLVMLGLSGMKRHLHPVIEDDSVVKDGTVIKIAVGARYFDMFHSATQLVKIGTNPTDREQEIHRALQEATLVYTDQFQHGAVEKNIYSSLGTIFADTARKHNLPGFEQSAYLHHAGGPLSPLGNRDFVISPDGLRPIIALAQFSVNPVDAIEYLKFELQGIVQPEGAPLILNEFAWCTDDQKQKPYYDEIKWNNKNLRLPTIIKNGEH